MRDTQPSKPKFLRFYSRRYAFAFCAEESKLYLLVLPLLLRIETANFFKVMMLDVEKLSNVGDGLIYSKHLTH